MNKELPVTPIDPCPQCGKNEAGDEDECPYAAEIEEEIVICRCCSQCREDCLESI